MGRQLAPTSRANPPVRRLPPIPPRQQQGNLTARLALLGELHWSLPRPPSEAERALKGRELPEWEAASKQLEGDIRVRRKGHPPEGRRLGSGHFVAVLCCADTVWQESACAGV